MEVEKILKANPRAALGRPAFPRLVIFKYSANIDVSVHLSPIRNQRPARAPPRSALRIFYWDACHPLCPGWIAGNGNVFRRRFRMFVAGGVIPVVMHRGVVIPVTRCGFLGIFAGRG